MKGLFRNNPLLAVSISLPLLVLLLFAAATTLPRLYTDPPAHDLLLTVDQWDSARSLPFRIAINIEGDEVVARVAESPQYQQGYLPRIFRYNHATGSVLEITIPVPPQPDSLDTGDIVAIPQLEGVSVSPELKAPDGYEFRGRSSSGGLMAELFGGSRRGGHLSLVKNGAVERIRLPESGNWYYRTRFLGWVVAEDEGE